MSDTTKKPAAIPSWQQGSQTSDENSSTTHHHTADPATQLTHSELLEQARDFLKDESIRNAPRERKVAFLEKKGLQASDIETLLKDESSSVSSSTSPKEQPTELKTVHDSTNQQENISAPTIQQPDKKSSEASSDSSAKSSQQSPRRDLPPIITYPEFLLKPQKPPPLITVDRLVTGAYMLGGFSTLIYSASKFVVEPMLRTLTEARHSLASTTIDDLSKLNDKLEQSVSHVPYIASASVRKSQDQEHEHDDDNDNESIISDPTELFHRDIATQTTPSLSRTQSQDSSNEHLDVTTQQVIRLASLHETLTSLVESLDPKEVPYLPPPASKKLRESITDFQSMLDKLETMYNPLRSDFYSSVYAQPADNSKVKSAKDADVAAKVRNEIRSLKGAFLSARNFPTAARPVTAYSWSQ